MKVRGQTVYTPAERIARLSKVDDDTGCWNWIGSTRDGYGRLMTGSRSDGSRRSESAHRYAYASMVGPIPDGLEACHTCDNPRCVNPKHLFTGTRQDNIDDREAKGRNNHVCGSRVGNARLTEEKVSLARQMRLRGLTYRRIAEAFGVDKKTIRLAISGANWGHVPLPPAPAAPQPSQKAP